jgi:hypothetical protein
MGSVSRADEGLVAAGGEGPEPRFFGVHFGSGAHFVLLKLNLFLIFWTEVGAVGSVYLFALDILRHARLLVDDAVAVVSVTHEWLTVHLNTHLPHVALVAITSHPRINSLLGP